MRCSALGLVALALFLSEAKARDCAKECNQAGVDCKKACEDEEDQLGATERELGPFVPTTQKPPFDPKKIIAPVVGGVIGAGALAGVIAVSVMKPPKGPKEPKLKAPPKEVLNPHVFVEKVTKVTRPIPQGATTAEVANQAGFRIGQNVVIDTGLPTQESNIITGFGSLIFKNPFAYGHGAGADIRSVPGAQNVGLAPPALRVANTAAPTATNNNNTIAIVAGVLGVLCLLVCCAAGLFLMNKKPKKTQKRGVRPEPQVPEDQQPLNSMMMAPAAESQYMPMGGMESQYMPVTPGIGAMPTLAAIPMQTMPPPTTGYSQVGYGGSPYGYGASPLANTVSALPTTAMPTQYNMGTVV